MSEGSISRSERQGHRVLIVEAEPGTCLPLLGTLESNGFQAEVANHPDRIPSLLESFSPDVALIGIREESRSGIDLISELKETHPEILCVGLTYGKAPETVIETLRAGAYDYVPTPVDTKQLLAVLGKCREQISREEEKSAARDVELLYKFSVEIAKDAIFWTEENGRIKYANQAACSSLGYTLEELQGKTVHDLDPEFPSEAWPAHWKKVGREGSLKFESRQRRKSGEVFPVEISSHHIQCSGKEYCCTVVQDLSEQKVAQTQLQQNKAGLVRAREEAGKELRKSDERFRVLIESSIQGVFIHRDFKPLFVNRSFAYNLGYTSPEDFISEVASLESLIHPEERDRLTDYAERRKNNLPAPDIIESRLLHKNGSTLWVQLIARVIDWEGLPAIQGTMIDITDRKLAEEKLKSSESIMAKAQQVAHLGSLEWDLVSNQLFWSDEVYRIMGLEPQSVEQNEVQFIKSLHPDDKKEVLLALTSSAATGESFSEECRVIRPDGEVRIVHGQGEIIKGENGKPLKMVGTVQDITERKQAEFAVRKSEQRFRDFAESSADWLWEMDENLRFTYLSPNVERIVSVPPEWHYGKTREELLGDDYDAKVWEKHMQDLHDRKPFRDFSYLRVGKGIESRWTSTSGKPIFSEDGTFLGYRGTGRDISELMRVQEELREKEERFRNLAEASILGILVHRGGKALFVNQSFADTFGYESPGDIMAMDNIDEMIVPEDKERLIAYSKARLNGGDAPTQYTYRGLRNDGSHIWLETNARQVEWDGAPAIQVINVEITERKKAEEKLRENQKLLETVFDLIPHAVYVKDSQSRYLMANRMLCDDYGLNPEEIVHRTADELGVLHGSELEIIAESDEIVFRTKKSYVREGITFTRADGRKKISRISKIPILDPDHNVTALVGLTEDITERVKAEEEIHANRRLLRTVFDTIPHALFVKDREGRYVIVNQAAVEAYGLGDKEYIGLLPEEVPSLTADSTEMISEIDQEVLRTGKRFEAEGLQVSLPEGEERILHIIKLPFQNDEGEIEGLVSISQDITERKKGERALKESEGRFRSIVRNLPNGFNMKDPQGRLQIVNQRLEEWFGLSNKEILGRKAKEVFPAVGQDAFEAMEQEVLKGRIVREEEFTVPFADGENHAVIMTKFPLVDEDDGIIGVGTITTDVTAQRHAEKSLRQAQRLEALGTLAGGIAHDLNNILFPIIGYSEVLLKQFPMETQAQSFLNIISSSALRAKDLVSQILLFSRSGEGRMDLCHIKPVAQEVVKLIRSTLPTSIEIKHTIARDLELVNADPSQIHQVMMNLCINAGQAMPDGGILTLTLENTDLKNKRDYLGEELNGPHIRIGCRDTGMGMDEKTMGRIFEPFFTTKGTGHGTGLGLATVFGIVQQHGGGMDVSSTPGKGTLFEIFLPVIQAELESLTDKPEPLPRGTESILFVDDEETITGFAKMVLEDQGFRVTPSTHSLEALKIFQAEPERFDLVVSDYTMPVMTGDKLAYEIKKIRADIPIVLSTGNRESLNLDNARSLGIAEVIYKPIGADELVRLARRVLDGKGAMLQPPDGKG